MNIEDRLALWVLGQLPADEDDEIARQLAVDPELARLATEYRDVLRLLPADDARLTVPDAPTRLVAQPWWTRRVPAVAAALALVVLGVGLSRALATPAPAGPVTETVAVAGIAAGVASAELINHTWGVELLLAVDDTIEGQDYTVWFLDLSGNPVAAGGFVGDADRTVNCRMNTPLLREETRGWQITDAAGDVVLEASLAPREATPGGVPVERA